MNMDTTFVMFCSIQFRYFGDKIVSINEKNTKLNVTGYVNSSYYTYIFSHSINFVSNPINTFGKMVLNETNVDKIVVYMCGIRGTNH